MKALMWKDYRLNRSYLIAGMAILLFPYAFAAYKSFVPDPKGTDIGAAVHLERGGNLALIAGMLVVALLGANAFAYERTERSAEFLAYLPPSRGAVLGSKLLVVSGAIAVSWLLNARVLVGLFYNGQSGESASSPGSQGAIPMIPMNYLAVTYVVIFGAAWCGSALVTSTAALLIGLLAPWFVMLVTFGLFNPERNEGMFWQGYWWLAVVLGALMFGAGSIVFLKRPEP